MDRNAIAFLVVVLVLAWRFRALEFTIKALGFEDSVKASGCPFHLFDPGLIESEADLLGGSVIGHRATNSTVKSPVTSGRRLEEGGTIASA